MENQQLEYGLISTSETEAMVKVLAEAFTRHDPLAVGVGLTPADFEAFVRTLLPNVAQEGLTVVARLRETGEIVGALLTEDAAAAAPEGMEHLGEKFGPIADILGGLVGEYMGGQAPRHGEKLHLYLLGVSDRATQKGVGQALVARCLENGAHRGYRIAFAEATNRTSQHIFRKLGFLPRVARSYQDHVFKGRRVFESIAAHGGPILMDMPILALHSPGSRD